LRRGRSWFGRATRIGCSSLGQGQSSIQLSCGLIWNFIYPRLLQNGHWIPVHNRVRSWNICSGTRADTRPFRLEPLPHPKLRRLFLQLLSFLPSPPFYPQHTQRAPADSPSSRTPSSSPCQSSITSHSYFQLGPLLPINLTSMTYLSGEGVFSSRLCLESLGMV
jgi:hypothetical protein